MSLSGTIYYFYEFIIVSTNEEKKLNSNLTTNEYIKKSINKWYLENKLLYNEILSVWNNFELAHMTFDKQCYQNKYLFKQYKLRAQSAWNYINDTINVLNESEPINNVNNINEKSNYMVNLTCSWNNYKKNIIN